MDYITNGKRFLGIILVVILVSGISVDQVSANEAGAPSENSSYYYGVNRGVVSFADLLITDDVDEGEEYEDDDSYVVINDDVNLEDGDNDSITDNGTSVDEYLYPEPEKADETDLVNEGCSHQSYETVCINSEWIAECIECREIYELESIDFADSGYYKITKKTKLTNAPYSQAKVKTLKKGKKVVIIGSVVNAYGDKWLYTIGGNWISQKYAKKQKLTCSHKKYVNVKLTNGVGVSVCKKCGKIHAGELNGDKDTSGIENGITGHSNEPLRALMANTGEGVSATCCVVMNDGSLWMWGPNLNGVIGKSLGEYVYEPVKVMDDVVYADAGIGFYGAIKSDGSLWISGAGIYGQKGKVMDDVTKIDADAWSCFALKKDGSLWGWGRLNFFDWEKTSLSTYAPIKLFDDVIDFACDESSLFVIKKDGTLWAKGYAEKGYLGTGFDTYMLDTVEWDTGDFYYVKEPIKIMDEVKQVQHGFNHWEVLKKDGSLWMWGKVRDLQTGELYGLDKGWWEGHQADYPVPIMHGMKSIGLLNNSYMCAVITDDDQLLLWDPGKEYDNGIEDLIKLDDVKTVCGGPNYYIAIKKDGSIWTYGNNATDEMEQEFEQSLLNDEWIEISIR